MEKSIVEKYAAALTRLREVLTQNISLMRIVNGIIKVLLDDYLSDGEKIGKITSLVIAVKAVPGDDFGRLEP